MSHKLLVILCALFCFCILLACWPAKDSIDSSGMERALLPMNFAHADHAKQKCVDCHHNFQDHIGAVGTCIHCHQTTEEVAPLIEEQFHDLCMGCHMKQHLNGEESGPLRSCQACHQQDLQP